MGNVVFGQQVEEREEIGIYLTEMDYVNNVITFLAATDEENGLVELLRTVGW